MFLINTYKFGNTYGSKYAYIPYMFLLGLSYMWVNCLDGDKNWKRKTWLVDSGLVHVNFLRLTSVVCAYLLVDKIG